MTCPHCGTGCLADERIAFTNLIDRYCIACGYHTTLETAPVMVSSTRWKTTLCNTCHEQPVMMDGCVQCVDCRQKKKLRRVNEF